MKSPVLAISIFAAGLIPVRPSAAATLPSAIGYNRQIRAVLSENCFFCHGPDAGKRKGKLRLDNREEAIKRGAFVCPASPTRANW